MDRAFLSGAAGSAPTAPASPSIGYATGGNPSTGTPATKPGPWWYHMITEELRAVIAAGGLTPSQSDITQLLQALPAALASRPEMARLHAANGHQKFPGGLILQWGSMIANTTSTPFTFPMAFPSVIYALVMHGATNSRHSSPGLGGASATADANGTGLFFVAVGK